MSKVSAKQLQELTTIVLHVIMWEMGMHLHFSMSAEVVDAYSILYIFLCFLCLFWSMQVLYIQ